MTVTTVDKMVSRLAQKVNRDLFYGCAGMEFGEVSGHRVLIKRGPGNRGPTECGTTHEATSGMSS